MHRWCTITQAHHTWKPTCAQLNFVFARENPVTEQARQKTHILEEVWRSGLGSKMGWYQPIWCYEHSPSGHWFQKKCHHLNSVPESMTRCEGFACFFPMLVVSPLSDVWKLRQKRKRKKKGGVGGCKEGWWGDGGWSAEREKKKKEKPKVKNEKIFVRKQSQDYTCCLAKKRTQYGTRKSW